MAENVEKTLEETKDENKALWGQLTKRNEQYMISLDRTLTNAGYDEDNKHTLYNQMMTKLVSSQKTGITARRLYGTVTECAENILQEHEEAILSERSPNWMIALDGGLLLGSIFSLISGVTLFTSGSSQPGMGIISLILNFIAGGLAMLVISKYQPDQTAPKGKKGFGKYIAATTGAMLLWMVAMTVTMVIVPESINVSMPPAVYLAIGALGLALKFYFKKKLHITGGLF